MSSAGLFDELGDKTRPAGLVARANAGPIVAVKVLVEKDQVAPVGIALEEPVSAGGRSAAAVVAQEDVNQAAGNLRGDLPEVGFPARIGGASDFEVFPVVVMKLLQGFHQ